MAAWSWWQFLLAIVSATLNALLFMLELAPSLGCLARGHCYMSVNLLQDSVLDLGGDSDDVPMVGVKPNCLAANRFRSVRSS